ncbi:MAG TPA: imidazole glycerol phosphate synthase subunit HisH [Rhodocyclaceae bacterium]|nr:imidazole glycerol phosphate synthase subunit HisH [Rhodocyclaceae bacterium]
MKVVVVDYGMGNLRSVAKAIEHVAPQADVCVSGDVADVARADRVVVPGQGAMPDCMREFMARGIHDEVLRAAASKPFLGICVGMQMLFEHSEEGDTQGLGILPGRVVRFRDDMVGDGGARLKVPHMGWNNVQSRMSHPLWNDIENGERFYFVHSYCCVPDDAAVIAATTDYGTPFTCAVARDNIFAIQFHPEKSASAGLQLLNNFMNWHP